MGRIEKTVFICYRRTNAFGALAIFQNLIQHGYDVFFDYLGIASGDFERIILENIRARAHFLGLLTPSALERCSDPDDWLRREIEAALDSQRNIVPLMLEGFDFGTPSIAKYLTGELAILKQYNALRIPPDYFLEAMGRLRDRFLNVPLEAVLHPASAVAQRAATKQTGEAAKAPTVPEGALTAEQSLERGINAQCEGDLEGALQDFDEAIRLNPDLAMAFSNRSNIRGEQGDLEGAMRDCDEAIRIQPDCVAFNNRGNARRAKGDLERCARGLR